LSVYGQKTTLSGMSAVGPTAARLRDPKPHLGGERDETVEPQAKSQKPVLVCYLVDNGIAPIAYTSMSCS
jgi:hypothetical protein